MDKVRDFLNEAGLGQYAEKFEEGGWDDLETVLSMTEEHIKTCIDKPGHARKLWCKIEKAKSLLQTKCNRETGTLLNTSSPSDAGTSVSCMGVSDSEALSQTVSPEDIRIRCGSPRSSVEIAKGQYDSMNEEEIAFGITESHTSVSGNKANDHTTNPDCSTTYVTDKINTPVLSEKQIFDIRQSKKLEEITTDKSSQKSPNEQNSPALVISGALLDERSLQGVNILNKSQVQSAINYQVNEVYPSTPIPARCTVIEKLAVVENVHPAAESSSTDQIETILRHQKKKHENLHVDTRAFQEANFILEDRHWLVIVGNPGDGKTWMGHQLVFCYRKRGYEAVMVTSADDWKRIVGGRSSCKQIALIDDIFGSVNLDDRKVSDWLSVLENAETLVKARRGDLMVVCTTRKIIYEDVKSKLSKYKIIEGMRLIDLTSIHKLTSDEKDKFLQKYQERYKVHLNKSIIFPNKKTTHGFPHCVEMFCTNKNLQKANEDFFSRPIEFLEKEMDNLYDSDPNLFCTLLVVLISQNLGRPITIREISKDILETAADCCCLSDLLAIGTFKKSVYRLTNIYIEQDAKGLICFKHPSYSEVVSMTITKKNPDSALDILTIDFLVERTKCCNVQKSIECVVTLPTVCNEKLSKRLTEGMLSNCYTVFRHQAFTCNDFLEIWLNYLLTKNSENEQSLLNCVIMKEYLYLWSLRPLLCCVPSSSLNFLIPKLTHCEMLLKYWSTDKGILHSTQALHTATIANCSTDVLGCLLDIGAKTVFEEERQLFGQRKVHVLLDTVAVKNIPNAEYLVYRGACPCVIADLRHSTFTYMQQESKFIEQFKRLITQHTSNLPIIEKGTKVSLCHLFAEKYDDYIVRYLGDTPILSKNGFNNECLFPDKLPKTDLHSVTSYLDIKQLKKMIESGADADLTDCRRKLPLFKAMNQSSDAKTLTFLAQHTKNLNVKDVKGRNAFHYLALVKRIESRDFNELVQLFTKAGCNVNELDCQGRAPVALATFETLEHFINDQSLKIDYNLCPDLPLRIIRSNERDIIRKVTYLKENNICFSKLDKNKRNIVHIVAMSTYSCEIKVKLIEPVLKSKEIDINARDKHKMTPLMIAVFYENIDKGFIRFLLDNGAYLEGNCEKELAAIVKCLKEGIEYPGNDKVILDTLVSSFCNNATCPDDLMTIFEAGWIDLDKVLHFLMERKWKSAFLLENTLRRLSKDWMHCFYDFDTAKRLACSSFQNFNILVQAGLDIIVFSKDGLCLSWLPENDFDAFRIVKTIACYKVDIQETFSQIEHIESIEMELARRGLLKTFVFVLQNTPVWHWAKSRTNMTEILNIMLDTGKSIDDIPLKRLEEEEQFRKCLAERAPYVVRKCVEQFPIKLGFARQIFKHINQVLFANDIGNVLESAINAFNINFCNQLSPDDPNLYWDVNSDHLIDCFDDLMDILMENGILMDNQDLQDRTSLMILLQDDTAMRHYNSIRKLIDRAQSFHETDCEGKNILHYLAQAKLNVGLKQEMIKIVLQKGAKVQRDKYGKSPLAYILPEHVTPDMIPDLGMSGDNTTLVPDLVVESIWTANNSAQRNNDIYLIIQHINHECENACDLTGVTMLAHASRALNIELVKDLLKKGDNPNRVDILNQSPLHKLLCSEWLLSSKWMTKQLFDINHIEIDLIFELSLLIKCGVAFYPHFLRHLEKEVPEFQQHEFLLDLINRALGILYQLLENDADPNQMDLMGRSPLHLCAGAFIPDAFVCPAMKMLIAYGADVNLEDFQGVTPLMMCAQYVYTKHRRMNILIEAGASVIAEDYLGNGLPQHSRIGALRRTAMSLKRKNWSETTASQL